MIDLAYGYTDPIEEVGDAYCSDAETAISMAKTTGGHAWVEFWSDGNPVGRSELVHLEEVTTYA